MRRSLIILAILFPIAVLSEELPRPAQLALPTARQRAWQDMALGMFIHFAPNTWQDREYDDMRTPLSDINPDKLDTDQWVDAAAQFGAKYIVFVAKHVGGFCMWQTRTTEYSLKNTPWRGGKGDVVADLAASCKKKGIQLGIYLSPRDAKHGTGTGGRCKTKSEQQAYNEVYREQLTELLTRYGPITEIWFDGSQVVPVGDILKRYAPDAMIFQSPQATIRWVGNELGFAPYPAWNSLAARDAKTGIATAMHGDPEGDIWLPIEADVSLRRPNWFWSSSDQARIMTLEELMEIYYRSVGRGTNLLLNLSPDRSGLIPAADVARVREFGDELRRRFSRSVAETHATGYAVELRLGKPTGLDHLILQEDISQGERVREYRLEGLTEGKWISLGGGTAIGQLRLQPFDPQTLEAVRLISIKAAQTPTIRRLAVFATDSLPPKTWNDPARVWADDAAGRWTNGRGELDISKKIGAAGEYRLRFVPEGGATIAISEAEVLLDGIVRPNLLRPEKGRTDVLVLAMPERGQKVELRFLVRGAKSGTVLLDKL
jgi:alpha-L-fucosidase